MNLVYSADAVSDLERLRAFIAKHNPEAAQRIARDLITRIDNICASPTMGTEVPQDHEPKVLRDMVLGNYVVRYAAHPETIFILRIWHQREDRKGDAEQFAEG